ncbi:MAG: RES family NAD+ phosphorylase [Opitutaceae bacterium]|jgi:RES domain-containing protein|nr:RES family NAD+ phosphorylase [Opitutaceae bacterium]
MRAFRIALEKYARTASQAFGGHGGLGGMGRWHNIGRQIVYTSQSLSLSALESLVHIQRSDKIQPYVHWEIEIPDRFVTEAAGLPVNWQADQVATRAWGDRWLAGRSSVAVRVPSAIVPGESNVLINPLHDDFDMVRVVEGPVPFVFDGRLTRP